VASRKVREELNPHVLGAALSNDEGNVAI